METTHQNKPGFLYRFPKGSFGCSITNLDERRNTDSRIIRVLIADDHPYLIHGVESDLNKNPNLKIIGTACSYPELIEKAKELQPDIILHDLKMPGYETYNLKDYFEKLKTEVKCKIMIFSNETGWARVHRCLELGASAYIEKAIAIGKLAELIERIYKEDELLIYTAEQLPHIQFSPRQKEVLHYIMDGKENDEIASTLKIDIKTVQTYVNEVKAKISEAFGIHPIRPRTLVLLASKLGFGHNAI